MTSALKPVADRYNLKTPDERYQFRRKLRSLCKWYGYISQVCRLFDEELHKEYLFCHYLLSLLPAETTDMIDLEGKLKLEYYKLQKTFEGSIDLKKDVKGMYEPVSEKSGEGKDAKSPLEEIIEKINEKYKGNFTDADKVVITTLHDKLITDTKLKGQAQANDPQIFSESIFPSAFQKAAMEGYKEAQQSYSSMFEDRAKFNAIMSALGAMLYSEFRNSK